MTQTIDRRRFNGPGNWPHAHPDERLIRHLGVERGGLRPDDCWVWLGGVDRNGYGRFRLDERRVYVHRYVYEVEVGPIPPGYEIDHLCRNRSCVRPTHLEAVTRAENRRRALRIRYGSAPKLEAFDSPVTHAVENDGS